MVIRKTAISIEAGLLDRIKAAAADEGTSVSGWLAEAAAERLRHAGLGEYLDEYEAEFGAFTADELAEADRSIADARRAGAQRRSRADRAAS